MISTLPITVCFTHFKSLRLVNLEAALYSLRRQDTSQVESIVIVDNNSDDTLEDILTCVESFKFDVPVNLHSFKHDDPNKTHPWSTNFAVGRATTPWIFFTRSDYILDFNIIRDFTQRAASINPEWVDSWNGFVTANVYHLSVDVGVVNTLAWREAWNSIRQLPGTESDYTCIDAGVWMARRSAFNAVEGLDESLSAWGHAQTHFQYKLFEAGVQFERIPMALFFHPQHAGHRDIEIAHQQLRDRGVNLRDMWSRYEGAKVY